jgi:hypothetical protein
MPIAVDQNFQAAVPVRRRRKPKALPDDPIYAGEVKSYNNKYNLGFSEVKGQPRPKFSRDAMTLIEANKYRLTAKGYQDVVDSAIESAIACGKKTVSHDFAVVALNTVTRCGESRSGPLIQPTDLRIESVGREKQYTANQVSAINNRRVKAGKAGDFAPHPSVIRASKPKGAPSTKMAALQAGSVAHVINDPSKTREQKENRVKSFFNEDTANGYSWAQYAVARLADLESNPHDAKTVESFNKLEDNLAIINAFAEGRSRRQILS